MGALVRRCGFMLALSTSLRRGRCEKRTLPSRGSPLPPCFGCSLYARPADRPLSRSPLAQRLRGFPDLSYCRWLQVCLLHQRANEELVNISGIVVAIAPAGMEGALTALRALDGVEVHHIDLASHRVMVTQETISTEQQEEGLRSIQAVPGVLNTQLVYHWTPSDEQPSS